MVDRNRAFRPITTTERCDAELIGVLVFYLVNNHVVLFQRTLSAFSEVIFEDIDDSMEKLDHKQRCI